MASWWVWGAVLLRSFRRRRSDRCVRPGEPRRRCGGLLLAVGLLSSCAPVPDRPNVVLIVVDTLRADRLSEYGYELDTSPGLARLTGRATRFENAYAPSPWTVPSTVSILTGLWPVTHGTGSRTSKMSPHVVSLAEVLRDEGWDTAAISHNIHVGSANNFDQGFDDFSEHEGRVLTYPDVSEMTPAVRTWLDSRSPEKPWFLYLQPMNVHGPYRVPEESQSTLLGRPPVEGFAYQGRIMDGILDGDLELREEVDEKYLQSLNEKYDVAVRYTTDQLGALLDSFPEELFDEALIIVTSDHGEELFEHGGFSHAYSLYDEVVRIPLFVKTPGQQTAAVEHDPVSLTDVFPTIVSLAGFDVEHRLDGRPLPGTGAGPVGSEVADSADLTVARDLLFQINWPKRIRAEGILSGSNKLIDVFDSYAGEREVLLFDVEADPAETVNRAPGRTPAIQELRRRMRRWLEWHRRRGYSAPQRAPGEIDTEALEALGYID